MTTSSYDLQFTNFCKKYSSSEMSGVNDQYSLKDYTKFKDKIKNLTKSKINEKRSIIEKEIQDATILDNEIRSMNQIFIDFDKPNKIPDNIQNKFPRGYTIDDINDLTLNNLNNSAKEFKHLFNIFFSKIKLETGELESIFGSITNYSSIVPISFGLMSINGLWNLFEETYLKNPPQNFDKKTFFTSFLDKLAINRALVKIGNIEPKNYNNINNNLLYYEFDKSFWYDDISKITTPIFDSYGFFYNKPAGAGAGAVDKKYVYLKYSNVLSLSKNSIIMEQYLTNSALLPTNKRNIENIIDSKTDFKERILKPFNYDIFKESINKYIEEPRKTPKTLLEQISNRTDYQEIEVGTEVYNNMRALLHFSNIYTTYLRLLEHFFSNIIECYKIYQSACTTANNIIREDIGKLQNKLRILINIITLIPNKFKEKLVDYSTNSSFSQKFLGFTNTDYDYFTNYNIDNPDKFMKLLMIFFKINDKTLKVGGIPFLVKENYTSQPNRDIIITLSFFLKYRIKSIIDYKKLLGEIKYEANQKLPRETYATVKNEVTRIIDNLEKSFIGGQSDDNIFDNLKLILKYSIFFFTKLIVKTIKDFKYANGKTFKNNYDILKEIGKLKEYLNQYIIQLREKLSDIKYNIFHQFLYGNLSKYIYYAETYGKMKTDTIDSKLKELINSPDNRRLSDLLDNRANKFVNILTKANSIVSKRRLGIVGRKYNTLSDQAKAIIDKQINPEIYTSIYWSNYEKTFMDLNSNKKLFVIAVEPVINVIEKISKVNVYLIDLFQTLKSDDNPKIRKQIKTIDIYGKQYNSSDTRRPSIDRIDRNNTVTNTAYSNENNIIDLNHICRAIRDLAGRIQKSWSSDIKGSKMKKVFGRFFSAEGLHSPGFFNSTPGHRFAKTFGLVRRKNNLGYTATEILRLLINGKLSSSISGDEKVKFSLLMGYNDDQLKGIIETYKKYMGSRLPKKKRPIFADEEKYNKYKYDPEDPKNDWQIYVIKSEDYSSSNKMREWANRLLNSKPLVFPKKYVVNPEIIPLSNFNNIQAPFSRYFIKSWYTHKNRFIKSKNITDYLFEIYHTIYDKQKTDSGTNKTNTARIEQAQIFYSTETFFNFDIPAIDTNNLDTSTSGFVPTRPPNTSSLGIIENKNYLVTAGIPEVSGKFKNILDPTRFKPEQFMTRNRISNKPASASFNISNRLRFQEDSIKLLESFLRRLNITLDTTIDIINEKGQINKLIFNNDLTIEYESQIVKIEYDSKKNMFVANIQLLGQNQIYIQIAKDSIMFLKIESDYILTMNLLRDSSGNYYLENDYKSLDFRNIFNYSLGFSPSITNGFLFYVNKSYKNKYKLELLDDSKKSILDIKFTNRDNNIVYEDYQKISNFYYSVSKSIGIISIPGLNVYKRIVREYHKLDFDATNNFYWKKLSETGDENNFISYIRQQSGNTKVESELLNRAIVEFKNKHKITTAINSSGKFKITLKDGTSYTIDKNKVELTYKNEPAKKFNFKGNNGYVVIQEQNLINPEIRFNVTEKEIYILHIFDVNNNADMNFSGILRLDFEKDASGSVLILNSDYKNNTDIQDFLTKNVLANFIISNFFAPNGLTYNNFFEIYFGETDDSIPTLFFRPLDKNRKPMPYLNFSISGTSKELYLDNFDKDDDDQFVLFEIEPTKKYIYTDTDVELSNKQKFKIIFNNDDDKIYCFFTHKKVSAKYVVFVFDYDNEGYYSAKVSDDAIINRLKTVADPSSLVP